LDLSGDWSWRAEHQLTFPDWVANFVFGIDPEGPTTIARCEEIGDLTLIRTGSTFAGTLLTTRDRCTTRRGQDFEDPGGGVPTLIEVGDIRGRSVTLLLKGPLVDCVYRGVITTGDGGQPTTMEGTGRCIIPGHPKSSAPLDPPPAGTSKTLSWSARRQ
jgi:hypothetical protein